MNTNNKPSKPCPPRSQAPACGAHPSPFAWFWLLAGSAGSVRSVGSVLAVLFFTSAAFAADNIMVNFFLNHGSAYRDGSWVPVDVYVDNKAYDINGTLQVRTYSLGGDVQSPVVSLPIESPKQSTKRFRVYVFMQQCSKIDVQLYNGRRGVLDVPAFMQVAPIGQDDYLCLILDDAPEGYGFLSTSLFEGGKVRFYRENLDTPKLGHLADRLQCYEPFDLIVLGDIDPNRIAQEHRELLRRYVERGGTLVVCTGDHAQRYRGTWAEELAGARLGEQELLKGDALAAQVFDAADADGAVQTRETLVPALEPAAEGVLRLGKERTLATLRKVGGGHVAMIAVDADSQILQTCKGYLNLWRDLARRSLERTKLNHAEGVMLSAATLPRVAGVELAPVSSVITYLATYFIVAIVLNWLFWNWLKRREMAWVCLIVFSIGFTGYAMVFGTQGRARSTELEQIEILRLPAHSPIAEYTSYTGILAKGTGTFDGVQRLPGALLYEPKVEQYQYNPYGRNIINRPVTAVQEEPARFEELRVGASEMRFIVNSDYVALDGTIEGTVEMEKGSLGGTLTNKTGLKLRNALLLVHGQFYSLGTGDTWDLSTIKPYQQLNAQQRDVYYPGYYDPYSHDVKTLKAYEQQLARALLKTYDLNNNMSYIPEDLPPLVIAWADRAPFGGFDMSIQANTVLKSVMVVADVKTNIIGTDTRRVIDLDVRKARWTSSDPSFNDILESSKNRFVLGNLPQFMRSTNLAPANISLHEVVHRSYSHILELHVLYCSDPATIARMQSLQESPSHSDSTDVEYLSSCKLEATSGTSTYTSDEAATILLSFEEIQDVPFAHEVYRYTNWTRDVTDLSNIHLRPAPVWRKDTPQNVRKRANFHIPYFAFARLVPKDPNPQIPTSKGVVAWQP